MKLFNFFSKVKPEPSLQESYLSLILTPDKISAIIWDLDMDNVKVEAISEKAFTNSENLIHQAAVAIDTAAEKAGNDVAKVVFGLSQSYFEGEDISQNTTKILKDLSQNLELEAQAFVSLAAAINHFLKVEEGITPQAVLVGIFQSSTASPSLEVHLLKNNKIVATKTANTNVSLETIIQLIGQLKEEEDSLPSRIIIYGTPELELLEKLKGANLTNLFIHEPKIEVFESEKLARAVSFAQAADILGHDPLLHAQEKIEPKEEEKEEKQKPQVNELGFVAGEDILLNEPEKPEIEAPIVEDESNHGPQPTRPIIRKGEEYAVEFDQDQYVPEPVAKKQIKIPKLRIPNFVKKFKLPKPSKKLGIIVAVIIIALLGTLFIAGQSFSSALVDIKVAASSRDGTFTATVSPNSSFDQGKSQIPGQIISGQASNSQKGVVTGTKMVGTPAKGPVNIRNWTDQAKSFKAGAEIITSDGLKFTLDSDIDVPARGDIPGSAQVNVTAEEVGPSSNVGSNKTFIVVGYGDTPPPYDAKSVDPGISGGDSKQATVVSQSDLDKLASALTTSLTQKAKDDFKTKSQGAKIYDGSLVIKVLKKNFDKNAGDEASLVNLDMQIEASAVVFNENDLQKLISLSSQVSPNLDSRPEDITIIDLSAKRVNDTLNISGHYRAKLIPKLDQSSLSNQIAGKSIKEARSIILKTPQVSDVRVTFSPAFPLIDSIPQNISKIKFKIEIS